MKDERGRPDERTTVQVIPDTTGKQARFTLADSGESEYLPVVGWVVVMRLPDDEHALPVIDVEPVVEEESYGPIAAGDLQRECPSLRLRDVQ